MTGILGIFICQIAVRALTVARLRVLERLLRVHNLLPSQRPISQEVFVKVERLLALNLPDLALLLVIVRLMSVDSAERATFFSEPELLQPCVRVKDIDRKESRTGRFHENIDFCLISSVPESVDLVFISTLVLHSIMQAHTFKQRARLRFGALGTVKLDEKLLGLQMVDLTVATQH